MLLIASGLLRMKSSMGAQAIVLHEGPHLQAGS
jgi:hypothetical protein